MLSTNKTRIRGVVLDLRFADGFDYSAAGSVANLFLDSDQPLLSWAGGSSQATKKTNAITTPLAILVNSQTSGAAEALAATLRESSVGLIIGSPTAGQSSLYKEFSLSDGTKLRVATEQIKLGNDKPLTGIKPDIAMNVSLEDERAYLKDPYALLHKTVGATLGTTNQVDDTSTNRIRRRMNEAELVRLQKEGIEADEDGPVAGAKVEAVRPTLSDPALVRGVDLVKALAVVQQSKSKD
jgi:C-terminal processing protease CtpA/Prc